MPSPGSALAHIPLFAGVDASRRDALARIAPARDVVAGTIVAHRGDPATSLIVVELGALTASHESADGRRFRFGERTAPCAVDKVAVLDGGTHTAMWQTSERSRLRLLPAGELLRLIDDVPAARRHVLSYLADQAQRGRDQLAGARLGDTAARVAAWLLRATDGPGTRIILPGAQAGLGEAVGASRVSVNRALRALSAEGLVRVEPGAVTVLAPELLAKRADRAAHVRQNARGRVATVPNSSHG